jgi:hypothetical protein
LGLTTTLLRPKITRTSDHQKVKNRGVTGHSTPHYFLLENSRKCSFFPIFVILSKNDRFLTPHFLVLGTGRAHFFTFKKYPFFEEIWSLHSSVIITMQCLARGHM